MIPVKSLEFRMASIIRAGLRRAMTNIDISNLDASLRTAEEQLERLLYAPMHDQIRKTYSEGYVSGGNLINRHKPHGMKTAASPLGDVIVYEDPRIARATRDVIYGLKDSLGGHKNEIRGVLRSGYEKGLSIPHLTDRIERYFDTDRVATTRFARTVTNDVYNRAHLDRYEESGVVDGVEYSAHIDDRTSKICQMLNGTIWGIGDKGIQVPPMHFSCRSRLIPYFGKIPGKRDFKGEFGSEFVGKAEGTSKLFRSKYWTPMPHTKASATYQRSYFAKNDIKTITRGLNQAISEERKQGYTIAHYASLERLKKSIRYRISDPDKTVIADRFGKSLMLDKFDEHGIVRAVRALITQTDGRIVRETAKHTKKLDTAWNEVLRTRKGIAALEKDVLYYQKRIKADPSRAIEYHTIISRTKARIPAAKAMEQRKMADWNQYVDMEPSATLTGLKMEKERYNDLLNSFKFQKR